MSRYLSMFPNSNYRVLKENKLTKWLGFQSLYDDRSVFVIYHQRLVLFIRGEHDSVKNLPIVFRIFKRNGCICFYFISYN